ncbi:hypothetical protein N7463_005737 [Penicillium fimorum]|uniref:Uncharacterized protein n=1 Tax=Penicillium fimorum TaxID=1882269 RepID=A0A9X0C5E6_9EURO|nr:hypothetical protein N7463_005737 [Penicillium fimorum]
MTMRPDGEVTISSNSKYNNFNSNLRLNGLFVFIDFIDLKLDTGIIDTAPNIDLIDMHSEVKATHGPFVDPEDRWDVPPGRRTIPSYLDLIDLTTGIDTADPNNDSSSQAENANPIAMTVVGMNLIDLLDTNIIPVNKDLVNFAMRTGVIRHANSDLSGLSTTSGSINTFDLDPEDVNAVHATKWSSQSGITTVGSLPSGTDEWSPAFTAELVSRLDALIELFEEQLQ